MVARRAVYRLAFGQPWQEDLLEFMVGEGAAGQEEVRISLEPE